ncbi:cupredoxin family copper-binding protein [Chelatococcus sambhunathii]|uniref:Cupredoxin family copper-binding protein n=1 Tax=Chelatococcus sambhunathii TaxID=363953 RepID=A0ABU1DHE1_9HYPH|nr:cupredoxin family copper-binding protein [Chelatococcus sambhunathii]MDR4307542.1 cupredoxin family copper-binding protein [Chelatococcus sambhunathii]
MRSAAWTRHPFDRRAFLVASTAIVAGAALAPKRAMAEEPVEIDPTGAGGGTEVPIESMAFQTPEVKCKVGDTVTWVNKDGIAHNVHFRQGPMKGNPKAQGKMLNTGDKYSVKFLQAGDYSYVCTPHPMMKGKVIVEA